MFHVSPSEYCEQGSDYLHDNEDYTFWVYFEFYKKVGERWRWVSPGGYGPTGEKISIRKPFQIPGYPLESV